MNITHQNTRHRRKENGPPKERGKKEKSKPNVGCVAGDRGVAEGRIKSRGINSLFKANLSQES